MKRAYIDTNMSNCIPNKVMLAEINTAPQGIRLIDINAATKSSPHDLVELAHEIQKANHFVKINAQNKLNVIAEQMTYLKEQAEKILLEAKENAILHHAACNFVKHPGNIYHLYEKPSGQLYFSMLCPEEWGSNGPIQTYKGSYRLEHDHSWTSFSNIKSKDTKVNLFNRYLCKNDSAIDGFSNAMNIDS